MTVIRVLLTHYQKVDVERSEQATKDLLKEEGGSNANASSPMPKVVDVERNEQDAKDPTSIRRRE
ncbi:hypothetical protein ACEQPO_08500 [Bacillus sp. SL00103]